MRAIFSLSAAALLAACASFGTREEFKASTTAYEATTDASYEAVYACLLDRWPMTSMIIGGPRTQTHLFPETRRAEIKLAGRNSWRYLVEIEDAGNGTTLVRAYNAYSPDEAFTREAVQACT